MTIDSQLLQKASACSAISDVAAYGFRLALAEPVIGRAFARPVGSLGRDDEKSELAVQAA